MARTAKTRHRPKEFALSDSGCNLCNIEGQRAMAADKTGEQQAEQWCEGLIADAHSDSSL